MDPFMKRLQAWIQLARPHQYTKNGFVWLPLFFGHRLTDLAAVQQVFWAFVAFCLAASSIYVLNDIKDIHDDRRHPKKKHRPLANGSIAPPEAWVMAGVFAGAAAGLTYLFLPSAVLGIVCGYMLLNVLYSFVLKRLAIFDIFCIAIGFVLRVLAGGVAAAVTVSHWIIIMTFLLALFLALAKRRDDLLLAEAGHETRKSLGGYNLEFVSLSIGVMASIIIVAYVLYTVSPDIIQKHRTQHLYLTAFWVILGLMRYMQITFVEQRSGSPTRVLLKDIVLQIVIGLWLLNLYILMYRH
jgi:decaprenyl-phosphate phosphoribosyltransferase